MTSARIFLANCLLWLFTLTSPAVASSDLTTADLHNGVGDVKHDLALTDGGVGAALLHGVVGCIAAEAVDGNCGSGFVAGFGTELVAGSLSNGFEEDPTMTTEQQHAARLAFEQDRGAIVGAALGYAASGGNAVNVNQGSSISRSAVTYNRQLHTRELNAIREKAQQLAGTDGLSQEAWLERLTRATLARTDRVWSDEFDQTDVAANEILDEMITEYGATFEDDLGRQLGFLNETNKGYFRNANFNLDLIAANREFYDSTLSSWVEQRYPGVGGILTPSEIDYVHIARGQIAHIGEILEPSGGEIDIDQLKRARGLALFANLAELGRIQLKMQNSIADIDQLSDDGFISFVTLQNTVENKVLASAYGVSDSWGTGAARGLVDFIIETGVSTAVLANDLATHQLDQIVDFNDSSERNTARIEAIGALLANPDAAVSQIVANMKSRIIEANELFEAGDIEGAGRIMGQMEAEMASAATGVAMLPATARQLAIITRSTSGAVLNSGRHAVDDFARPANNSASLCFVAGTPVLTTDGYKNIEDIRVGDMVVSRDEGRQMTVVKPVVALFQNPNKEIYSVTLTSEEGRTETLGATAEHPFYVEGKGWVVAADLQPGDQVASHASGEGRGGFLLVKSVTLEDARQNTYNFEVADTHTYFVGHLNALVHNQCNPGDLIANGGRQLDNDTIIGAYGNRFTRNADGTYTNAGPATQTQITQAGVTVRPSPATNSTLPPGYTRNTDGTINGPGNPGGQQALFRETGQADASGNPILQRDSGSYFTIDATGNQQRVAANDLPAILRSRGEAPWQQSQTHIQQQVGGVEKSYLNGDEVRHGKPGSVRPDAVPGCETQCFEVKNYDLSSTSGQNSLVNTTVTQINQRARHLPDGMQQNISIDITGQNVSVATQAQIRADIVRGSNGAVAPESIDFFVRP